MSRYATRRTRRLGSSANEINFNRYLYQYVPPRALEDIEIDIKEVERDVLKLLQEVAGERSSSRHNNGAPLEASRDTATHAVRLGCHNSGWMEDPPTEGSCGREAK